MGKPGQTEGIDYNAADGHSQRRGPEAAVPASLGEEADYEGGGDKAEEIAPGGTHQVGHPSVPASEDGSPQGPGTQVA